MNIESQHARTVCEIEDLLLEFADTHQPWKAGQIALRVLTNHEGGLLEDNADADWMAGNAYQHVRKLVTECINSHAGPKAERPDQHQFELQGFERKHLQDYYTVDRDGERGIGIYVMLLTDAEIDEKIEEKVTMGKSCFEHADELRRFKDWRRERMAA